MSTPVVDYYIGRRTVRSETTLLPRHLPYTLAVVTEAGSDDLQQYLDDVFDQPYTPVAVTHYPLFLVEYLNDIVQLLGTISLPPNADDVSTSICCKAESPIRVALNSSTGIPFGQIAFPLANDRMTFLNSCIVSWTPSGVIRGRH